MTQQDVHVIFLVLHFVGLAMGAGGAMLTDVIFVTSVRERHVNHTLEHVMRQASAVVLSGYGLLIVSGGGLLLTGSHPSQRFAAKMVMVAVLGLNGFFAHIVTFPHLSAKMKSRSADVTLGFLHQLAGTAAISGVSWWMAVVAGTWKSSPWPFIVWIGVYLGLLVGAVVMALAFTPQLLRANHPEFSEFFPTVVSHARRAQMIREKRLIHGQ